MELDTGLLYREQTVGGRKAAEIFVRRLFTIIQATSGYGSGLGFGSGDSKK